MSEILSKTEVYTPNNDRELELIRRFLQPERMSSVAKEYLSDGAFGDIRELAAGKQFVMGIVEATNPRFADLGKGVETPVFAERFQRPMTEVYDEYEPYDSSSIFLIALDVSDIDNPIPAGSIRIIEAPNEKGLKSIKDLVADSPENPWHEELQEMLFDEGEAYDEAQAWKRLNERAGVSLDPAESHDVATLAVKYGYAQKNGDMDGVSIRLYHTCLRYAQSKGIKNLVSIQDIGPLNNLQQFGNPFDTFQGLQPHPYGGPGDTIPAYAVIKEGMVRVRDHNKFLSEVFIEGFGLQEHTLLLQDLDPETYSNESVGLASVPEAA